MTASFTGPAGVEEGDVAADMMAPFSMVPISREVHCGHGVRGVRGVRYGFGVRVTLGGADRASAS
ncbi:hypothetical protein GCM10009863_37730 [Streptomyces axinellae]|uniref:Uncharacterized protein n=1 Tax=Streptomyces axinellae TaxID=552788 RepID=A0ABN3Q9K9_9ACTN